MRLFVAVAFNSATKEKISELCEGMSKSGVAGNFTPKDNLHLTLKFLGEVESARVAAVKSALDSAVTNINPFTLQSGNSGFFTSRSEKTIWLGLAGEGLTVLYTLAGAVDISLCKTGFEPERRAFTPHITLARRAVFDTGILESVKAPEFEFTVNSVTLFESRRDAGRLWYKPAYISKMSK